MEHIAILCNKLAKVSNRIGIFAIGDFRENIVDHISDIAILGKKGVSPFSEIASPLSTIAITIGAIVVIFMATYGDTYYRHWISVTICESQISFPTMATMMTLST